MKKQLTEDEIASMNACFAEAKAAYEAGRYAEAFARFEEMVAFARECLGNSWVTVPRPFRAYWGWEAGGASESIAL